MERAASLVVFPCFFQLDAFFDDIHDISSTYQAIDKVARYSTGHMYLTNEYEDDC